jgi:hypothetical protein
MDKKWSEPNQKSHSITEITPTEFPFTKVEISGEEVLTVNQLSSWEIDRIFTDYRWNDRPHEVFIVVFKRKEEEE